MPPLTGAKSDKSLAGSKQMLFPFVKRENFLGEFLIAGKEQRGMARADTVVSFRSTFSLEPTEKMLVIARDDGGIVPARGSCNVTVFNRHAPTRPC